jgi:PH (Pleckstrin Homology) domain-containing protein
MIRFNCDKCEMEIEVEDALAGTKHECLGCGDINRVPVPDGGDADESGAPDSKKADRAAQAGFPPDFGAEVRVQIVRRCWFRSRAIRFSLVVLAILVGLVGLIWVPYSEKSWMWIVLFVPMVLGGIGLLVWWWIDRLAASIEITTKRTIMHRGIFSKSSSEVVHDNIRNIQIEQTFPQRVMGVGKIGISSSGQDGIELQVNHLKDPDNLRKIIDLYRPL